MCVDKYIFHQIKNSKYAFFSRFSLRLDTS